MFILYILKSSKTGKYYIGHSGDLERRLSQHNHGLVHSTKFGRPWIVVYQEFFDSKQEAYKRELQIKSYKGGEAFRRLIDGSVPKRSNGADCKSVGLRPS